MARTYFDLLTAVKKGERLSRADQRQLHRAEQIAQLIRAATEDGRRLSPAERRRVDRYEAQLVQQLEAVTGAPLVYDDMWDAGYRPAPPNGDVFGTLQAFILRNLDTDDAAMLRKKVRWLLECLEGLDAHMNEASAAWLRRRRGQQKGGHQRMEKARAKRSTLLADVTALKAKHAADDRPILSDSDAVRQLLRETPAWRTATDEERDRLVATLTRRLRRARQPNRRT